LLPAKGSGNEASVSLFCWDSRDRQPQEFLNHPCSRVCHHVREEFLNSFLSPAHGG